MVDMLLAGTSLHMSFPEHQFQSTFPHSLLPPIEDPHTHLDQFRRRRREARHEEDKDDAMHEPGVQVGDNLVEISPIPSLSCTCFLDPRGKGRPYFFSGDQLCIINVRPGTTSDTLEGCLKPVIGNWPSLFQAPFGNVDAILPSPIDSGLG